MKLWALLLVLSVGSGCSTLSNRQKTIAAMVLTGSIAGTFGVLSAPKNESAPAHAALLRESSRALVSPIAWITATYRKILTA